MAHQVERGLAYIKRGESSTATDGSRRSTRQHAVGELQCAEAAIQQAYTMQQLVNASPSFTHRRLSPESEVLKDVHASFTIALLFIRLQYMCSSRY
jgi:hypothetical protein